MHTRLFMHLMHALPVDQVLPTASLPTGITVDWSLSEYFC